MIFEPPRHGKSELASRLFSGYLVYRFPEKWTAISSYAAELAYGFSRNARDNYLAAGGELKQDAQAVKQWETGSGGGLWACGVGGPATGRGFHFGIVDDPLKNAEEAASETIRNKQWDWWASTWSTREEPGAAMIVVQTRWNEDDLSGRLLRQEQEYAEEGAGWHIVSMEAIKEKDTIKIPDNCTLEPDDREVGEPLCPERYSLKWLLRQAKKLGLYFWNALYQQRPAPLEGVMWKRDWFLGKEFSEAPGGLLSIGYDWDTAYTEKETNSATAYCKAAKDQEGSIYILDVGFRWLETPAAEQWMVQLKGPHYVEAKASGKSLVPLLRNRGIAAIEVNVQGGLDKVARTSLVTPYAESGKVFIAKHVKAMLLDDERQGILKFPNATNDDLNDAVVQALNRLAVNKWWAI